MTSDRHTLGMWSGRLTTFGLGVGLLALLIGILVGALGEGGWTRFFRAYLFATMFAFSLSLGALFFTMVQHATRAGWSIAVRRIMEAMAGNLRWMWILFLPILLLVVSGHGDLVYSWLDVEHAADDHALQHKAPFLNKWFWVVRSLFYLGVWAFLGSFFFRNSVAQDSSGDVRRTHAMQALAPAGLILYALTQTFASIDWIMTLEAHWFSTMFGVYFFAASCCGFFATLILFVYFLQRQGKLENEITLEHYQDMGKLLFAFGVVFWAYIGFSQFMLIWYGNIPEETMWYMARMVQPWTPVSLLLLVGHFALPFLLLVTKHTKRVKWMLATIACWMLLMHAVDVYWLVMPQVPMETLAQATSLSGLVAELDAQGNNLGFHPGLVDLACWVGLSALFIAGVARQLGSCSLLPEQDPRLAESLAFENM